MAQKSILEQALLQVQTLEDAVKANAKGILASTMKQELNDLLKEQEDEKDPDEDEKDVTGAPEDEKTSDKEPTAGEELPTGDEELPAVDNELEGGEPEGDEVPTEDEDSEDVLDMTGASEEEVLKVFKAMKPEDGIVVKKEGNTVQFSDEDNEYIIKLDDETGEGPEETPDKMPGETPDEIPDELSEQQTVEPDGSNEEIVYEIELDDDETKECEAKEEVKTSDGKPFEKKVGKVGKKLEAKESVTVQDTVTIKDGQPFDKTSPQTGVKKLETDVTKAHKVEAKEQEGIKRPGSALPGTSGPQTKEPGKGGTKVTQSEKFPGTAPKGTDNPEKKDPGKGGTKVTQAEDHPGEAPEGTGHKPVVKEPKEQECKECDKDVKEVEATEAARTKWNIHGDKGGGEGRAGIKGKKLFKAGSKNEEVNVNEEVETLKLQNDEYRKALVLFKDKLNEVAVFNANLAYATRLFTEHSTTKQEKLEILQRFDTISTITESKNLYTTIKAELENKKPISEAAVEKIASSPSSSSTEMLSESKVYENPQFKRMKELMKKIK
jgi:hypothetical protein